MRNTPTARSSREKRAAIPQPTQNIVSNRPHVAWPKFDTTMPPATTGARAEPIPVVVAARIMKIPAAANMGTAIPRGTGLRRDLKVTSSPNSSYENAIVPVRHIWPAKTSAETPMPRKVSCFGERCHSSHPLTSAAAIRANAPQSHGRYRRAAAFASGPVRTNSAESSSTTGASCPAPAGVGWPRSKGGSEGRFATRLRRQRLQGRGSLPRSSRANASSSFRWPQNLGCMVQAELCARAPPIVPHAARCKTRWAATGF